MTDLAVLAVARLRRIVAALAAGDDDAQWLSACLCRYLEDAERDATLELLLGLAPAPGGTTWWEAERRDRRDALLHEMAGKHCPGQSPRQAARKLNAAWRRYARCRLAIERRSGATDAAPGQGGSVRKNSASGRLVSYSFQAQPPVAGR